MGVEGQGQFGLEKTLDGLGVEQFIERFGGRVESLEGLRNEGGVVVVAVAQGADIRFGGLEASGRGEAGPRPTINFTTPDQTQCGANPGPAFFGAGPAFLAALAEDYGAVAEGAAE